MARQLKPQKVDSVGAGQARVDVYLDRNALDFFARLGLEEVRAASADECKKLARDLASRWRPESWKQVILVERSVADNAEYHMGRYQQISFGVTLLYRRVERAKRLDGSTLERPHELDYQERLARLDEEGHRDVVRERRESLDDCERPFTDSDEVELSYTEAAWVALEQIGLAITDASRKLEEMLEAPDVAKLLQVVGSLRMLPGPKRDEE